MSNAVFWLSTKRMTIMAEVDGRHVVVDAAPVAKKFVGQSLYRLVCWLGKQGGLKVMRLK